MWRVEVPNSVTSSCNNVTIGVTYRSYLVYVRDNRLPAGSQERYESRLAVNNDRQQLPSLPRMFTPDAPAKRAL